MERSGMQTDGILETTTRTKVHPYRAAYATRSSNSYAFLPCAMSTLGWIHPEFLELLYIAGGIIEGTFRHSLGPEAQHCSAGWV